MARDYLKFMDIIDIESIPISSKDSINESKHIILKQIEIIRPLKLISPIQQELKSWHNWLSHLHLKSIILIS